MNLSKLKLELETVDKVELGKKVKQKREEIGLNQSQLAEAVECDQSTISAIESGKKKYSSRKLADVARYFNDDFELKALKEVIHSPQGIKRRFEDLSLKFGIINPSRRNKSEVLLESLEREIEKQLLLREIEEQLIEKSNKANPEK